MSRSTDRAIRFVLPLRNAPTLNVYSRLHWTSRQRLKLDTFTRMLSQHGRRSEPLPGKVRVEVIRYSRTQPDRDGLVACAKIPLDCLKSDKQGLGFIVDDSPEHVEVRASWRKAQTRDGRIIVEVLSIPREVGEIGEEP